LSKEKFMTELVNKLLLECPKATPTMFTKRLIGYARFVTNYYSSPPFAHLPTSPHQRHYGKKSSLHGTNRPA